MSSLVENKYKYKFHFSFDDNLDKSNCPIAIIFGTRITENQ